MNAETVLRDALAADAGSLGVPGDVWTDFTKRERTHRRHRRIRIAGVAAVLAAAVVIQTGLVVLPGWAPGIAVAGHATALATSPTRGSLAGDTAFLAGMRRSIKDVQDPGELWKVADRKKIKFVYAADLPDRRLVLALVPLRFGFLTDQMLAWYEGKPGAAPEQMTDGSREDGGTLVTSYLDARSDRPGVLVVVAPSGSTVAVSTGFTYSAAGRVEHGTPKIFGDGLAETAVPPSPVDPGIKVTVTRDGRTLHDGSAGGSWSGGGAPTVSSMASVEGHGFDRDLLQAWADAALTDARLSGDTITIGLPWTGTVDGQPAALLTLNRRGHGVLAYAFHGRSDSYRQDLRLLLPAAGADRRPIAWRMRAEGKDDRTDLVNVVAQAGATRAVLTVAGAAAVPVELDAKGFGTATLDPDAAATVTSYAEGGSVLGVTPVPPFETNSSGIPGDDTRTRVVP